LQATVEMLHCNKQTTYQTIGLTVSQTTITNTNTHLAVITNHNSKLFGNAEWNKITSVANSG